MFACPATQVKGPVPDEASVEPPQLSPRHARPREDMFEVWAAGFAQSSPHRPRGSACLYKRGLDATLQTLRTKNFELRSTHLIACVLPVSERFSTSAAVSGGLWMRRHGVGYDGTWTRADPFIAAQAREMTRFWSSWLFPRRMFQGEPLHIITFHDVLNTFRLSCGSGRGSERPNPGGLPPSTSRSSKGVVYRSARLFELASAARWTVSGNVVITAYRYFHRGSWSNFGGVGLNFTREIAR